MLVLELLYAAIDFGQPLGPLVIAVAALNVAQSARALDVLSSPRSLEFQLPQMLSIRLRSLHSPPCQSLFWIVRWAFIKSLIGLPVW